MAESTLWELLKERYSPKANSNAQQMQATSVLTEFLELCEKELKDSESSLLIEIPSDAVVADFIDILNDDSILSSYIVDQVDTNQFKVRQRVIF